jgi:hypothetical protein
MNISIDKKYIMVLITVFLIFLLLMIYLLNIKKKKSYLLNKKCKSNIRNDTFYDFINTNKNIIVIDTKPHIIYENQKINSQIGSNIYYEIYCKIDKKKYTILRYADFRNEIKRHSIEYINAYLNYLNNKYMKENINYILDFTGFHGYIDNKVNLWVEIKNKYGRNTANKIMCKTYLIPNDYQLFTEEYNKNNKYVLKNSFGGARSGLKITDSLQEIEKYFFINKEMRFNPEMCKDSVCHSKVKYNIVQKFIEPGLLIDNRKVGFRMYLVIFSQGTNLSSYLYNDGVCYYSKNKYNKKGSKLNDNVVGSIFDMQNYIEKNKLPIYFSDFIKFIKKNNNVSNQKLKTFIEKLKHNCSLIINSVKDKLVYFTSSNIKKFCIYGLDVEYDNNFDPFIFEGNFYFTRFKSNNKYGNLVKSLYNDIFTKMNLNGNMINGFQKIE